MVSNEDLQITMSSTTDSNELEQTTNNLQTLDLNTATPTDKPSNFFALPAELRQRILLFSITDEDLSGYTELSLNYYTRPVLVPIKNDPKKCKLWKNQLDLVHAQVNQDMVWVFKKRKELAKEIPGDGREARWAAGY